MIKSAMPMPRNAVFLISASRRSRRRFLRARNGAGRVARGGLFGRARDDEHLLEAREIDGRHREHLLIDAEVALRHLGDRADGEAFGKAAADAARDQEIADLDL